MVAPGTREPNLKTVSSLDAGWMSFQGLAEPNQNNGKAGPYVSHLRVCKLVFGCLLFAAGLSFHRSMLLWILLKSGVGRGWVAQNQGWLKIRYEKGFGLPMLLKNRVGRVSEKLQRTMKKGLGATWFPRAGWEWLGKTKKWSMKKEFGTFMVPKSGVEKGVGYFVVPKWGGKGQGRFKMKHEMVPKWGGTGLGRPKMKHEKGVGCFMVHKSGWEGPGKVQNEAWKRSWVLRGSCGVGRG